MLLQPTLKRHQQLKKPGYMQQRARDKLEADGAVSEPDLKRRRSQDVLPLSQTTSGASKLPELPDDLKQKQVWCRLYFMRQVT